MPRTEHFEQAFAVVRVDRYQFNYPMPDDWSAHVKVKEIWWTVEEAEAEVDRPNALDDEKGGGSPYHCQPVRVRRR